MQLLRQNKLDKKLYYELDSKEKEMLDRLSHFAGIREKIGSGLYSREKEQEKEFELLKYQILSGNNSRQGLKKMQKYIHQYLKEKKILIFLCQNVKKFYHFKNNYLKS